MLLQQIVNYLCFFKGGTQEGTVDTDQDEKELIGEGTAALRSSG